MFDSATAYYAAGAGLGHLRRMTKVVAALNVKSPLTVLSNSRFFSNKGAQEKKYQDIYQRLGCHEILQMPAEMEGSDKTFFTWLDDVFDKRNIKNLIVDTFPVGIKGELNGLSKCFPEMNIILVARLLKWQDYQSLIQSDNRFAMCYCIEPLGTEYEQYLQSCTGSLTPLVLPSFIEDANESRSAVELPKHFCAVVHSGSLYEIEALLRYTQERLRIQKKNLPIVLISPDTLEDLSIYPGVTHVNIYPALPVLLKADLVVSGAGFNTLHELKGHCKNHWVVPFERRYDDQFLRTKSFFKR